MVGDIIERIIKISANRNPGKRIRKGGMKDFTYLEIK
jgi:hypothetical protein